MYFYDSQVVGEKLPYDTLNEIRGRLEQVSPNLTRYGEAEEANFYDQAAELSKVSHLNYSFKNYFE